VQRAWDFMVSSRAHVER
jgi:hypothetical protein